jgi:hypothetical protein
MLSGWTPEAGRRQLPAPPIMGLLGVILYRRKRALTA